MPEDQPSFYRPSDFEEKDDEFILIEMYFPGIYLHPDMLLRKQRREIRKKPMVIGERSLLPRQRASNQFF